MVEVKCFQLKTSLSAFELFSQLKQKESIFLDSSKVDGQLGKYSFFGLNPFLSIVYREKCYEMTQYIKQGDQYRLDIKQGETNDIFQLISEMMSPYEIENKTEYPFIAGGMGYFAYDLVHDFEKIPKTTIDQEALPTCYFVFYDQIIGIDHHKHETFLATMGIHPDEERTIKSLMETIENDSPEKELIHREYTEAYMNDAFKPYEMTTLTSLFSKNEYEASVEQMRQYIKKGDIYIANMTQTFTKKGTWLPLETYEKLRTINPAPFSAYIQIGQQHLLSSSPERFLQIKNRIVKTRPIKGTRPRGKSAEEDLINAQELRDSEKDKSELLMIVDLERNDLSKVCRPHSIKVTELFEIEKYATVFHLVATIEGELDNDKTSLDCIKACFPGGSITGTPKIRAMEIIEELERNQRGLYTGCIGYLGFDGSVDLNIVIRTIILSNNTAHFGVGGGITWESNPEEEYYETLDKAKALQWTLKD